MPSVKMVQTSKNRWRIETWDGKILLDDIVLGISHEAEEFVKRYISSFQAWDYELEEKWKKSE